MHESDEKIYAVLTGDIVKSGRLSADELHAARECLRTAVGQLHTVTADKQTPVVGTIDYYRGDGWQLVLDRPQYALHAALFLRASLKARCGVDTRIAVGMGPVEHIDPANVSQSSGKAFELSGSSLDSLKAGRRMTVSLHHNIKDEGGRLVSIFELSDAIVQKWSGKQARALTWAMQGLKQAEVAGKFEPPITWQAAGKMLRLARWPILETVLKRTEKQDVTVD